MATRTIVRYRSRPKTRRHSSRSFRGSRGKIPLGVIAGLIPGVQFAAEPVMQGRTFQESMGRVIAGYTGYDIGTRSWSTYYLMKGLLPLLGGMLLHGIANYTGLNRMIGRFRLPVEI